MDELLDIDESVLQEIENLQEEVMEQQIQEVLCQNKGSHVTANTNNGEGPFSRGHLPLPLC